MGEKKKIQMEEIHKEIDLIQSCITRMAQNSFMVKGWFVSLYAVVLALLPEKINLFLLCTVLIMVNLMFWYLDAFFLRTEKIYRKIYDWVLEMRPKNNRELLYQLNPKEYDGKIEKVESIRKVMWSRTLRWFYSIPLIIVIALWGWQFCEYIGPIISCVQGSNRKSASPNNICNRDKITAEKR